MTPHHGLTIHGSGPNSSDDRRIACVIRHMAPDMKRTVGEKAHAMLVRGKDAYGNFIHLAPSTHDFAPAALTLYEETRKAQSAVMMKGAAGKTEMYS